MAKEASTKKSAAPKEKKEKATRTPSPYNEYMKEEIAKVKKAQPDLAHKDAFKAAAANVSFLLFASSSSTSSSLASSLLCLLFV